MPSPAPMDFLAKHFEFILDALPDGVFISDVSGITLRVNRMYEQLTGLKQEDVQGKQVRALVENGVFDKVLNPEIVRTGKPATHVQQLQNGKKLVLSGFPVFDESGALRLVVTFVRDITMITRLNEQMEEQRHLIEQYHEQMAYITQKSSKTLTPVYESELMHGVVNMLKTVAPTDASVLLLGETGVGKDVFARLTHGHSARKDKIFLKVDCGGISETLTESEMFGYMPGAFTGASSKGKAGYFELADGGTVFLDEIGELPLSMQTRLLRVLQERKVTPLGGGAEVEVTFALICATHRDLPAACAAGQFRNDLYYRINGLTLRLPALRERTDFAALCARLLDELAPAAPPLIAPALLERLAAYDWPGNLRQLASALRTACAMLDAGECRIDWTHLPDDLVDALQAPQRREAPAERPLSLDELSLAAIRRAVDEHAGNLSAAARQLGVSRQTLYRKLARVSRSGT